MGSDNIIPKEINGWSYTDFDLANSEESSDRIASFLNSENDTVFGVAAQLAGLWKVESSRPEVEKILNDDRASPARSSNPTSKA